VTGRHSNQLNYQSKILTTSSFPERLFVVGVAKITAKVFQKQKMLGFFCPWRKEKG
jgi:hypothetical protein